MGDHPSKFHLYDPAFGPPLETGPVAPGPDGEPIFEIGLVLAGAVSAGAYTGGVLDFLTEALDAFEAAKLAEEARVGPDRSKWSIPGHSVRVRVVTGASAGGMTAAMLAASQGIEFPHLHNATEAGKRGADNPYYDAWVNRINIEGLLGTKDLEGGVVHSLLDCTPLDDIVKTVLDFPVTHAAKKKSHPRAWLADAPKICMTITNMRGIPYSFEFPQGRKAIYAMTRHADCQRFVLAPEGDAYRGDEIRLSPGASSYADESWRKLGQAALATGSFPVALRSRTIEPTASFYRSYHISTFEPGGAFSAGPPLLPNQRAGVVTVNYVNDVRASGSGDFASADGGIIDNEPLELAHVELAGIVGRNPREARYAQRALLMVYPFPEPPNDTNFETAEGENVLQLGVGLISTLKEQARFHPDDIELALKRGVYSRFMIYPARATSKDEVVKPGKALACGALGAFSGFLCEDYRRHDFLLGRANCRSFLERYFRLPIEDDGHRIALFEGQPPALDCDGEGTDENAVTRMFRPIIPLSPSIPATDLDPWPLDKMRPEDLANRIRRRIKAVGNTVLQSDVGPPFRSIIKFWWSQMVLGHLFRWWVANRAVKKLRSELVSYGLLRP